MVDINNVMLTAYVYTDDSERVEFDKKGIADVLNNSNAVDNAEYRDSIPKNTRVEMDRYNVISISSKSIIAREPSVSKAKQAVDDLISIMDELDEENDLGEIWDVEYNVSSVVSSSTVDVNIDLYDSKNIFDQFYKHVTYYSSIGYLKLDVDDSASVYIYESGKYTVKGAKSVDQAVSISEEFEKLIDDLNESNQIKIISDRIQEIKNKDATESDITPEKISKMTPEDLNVDFKM